MDCMRLLVREGSHKHRHTPIMPSILEAGFSETKLVAQLKHLQNATRTMSKTFLPRSTHGY